jgi:response regulator of citrate/malate metabolism
MTTQLCCPFCSSEKVYSLLNTLHCKRCKNIWQEDKKNTNNFDKYGSAPLINNQAWTIKKKTENLEKRMEKKLNEYLKRFNGKFSMDKITWKIGDITIAMFRRYLKICVKNKILVEKKDKYGIIWYSRPD